MGGSRTRAGRQSSMRADDGGGGGLRGMGAARDTLVLLRGTPGKGGHMVAA